MSSHISFKILVVGDEDVGKTTIVNHYTLMPISFSSTIGIEFQSRMVALSAEEAQNLTVSVSVSKNAITPITPENMPRIKHYDYVKCYFWDTSGSARYQSLSHTYYTNISAAIVVFDLSNELSYKNLYSYIYRIIQKNICTHTHPILVIGNKLDKRKINKTHTQICHDLCLEFPNENIKYAEVSCIDKIYTDEKLNNINNCNNKTNTVYNCATCANSSELHYTITSFLQFAYDSAIKPHYYDPNAISAIRCSGINGTTKYFNMKKEKKEKDGLVGLVGLVVADEESKWNNGRSVPFFKTPRQCCDEHYYSNYSSSSSREYVGCGSCSIL